MTGATGWLGSKQAAAYLGVRSPTLYRLANAGTIVSYRIGRVLRYRVDDLDAYLARVRVRPGDLDHLVPRSSRSPLSGGVNASTVEPSLNRAHDRGPTHDVARDTPREAHKRRLG